MTFFCIFIILHLVAGCYCELLCGDQFPLRDTVSIIKGLVKEYGFIKNHTDADGSVWENVLILQKQKFEWDGVEYYLNDVAAQPENTFYFEQLQFLSIPTFVVPTEILPSWNAVYPDKSLALSKISFTCEDGQRACGLKCCPNENYSVQKALKQKLSTFKKSAIPEGTSFEVGKVQYYLNNENSTCEYQFSYHDEIMRLANIQKYSTIYFSCPTFYECCGLTCQPMANTEFASYSVQEGNLSFWSLKPFWRTVALSFGTCLVFVVFIVVTYHNYRRSRAPGAPSKIKNSRASQHTQTSKLSLSDMESNRLILP